MHNLRSNFLPFQRSWQHVHQLGYIFSASAPRLIKSSIRNVCLYVWCMSPPSPSQQGYYIIINPLAKWVSPHSHMCPPHFLWYCYEQITSQVLTIKNPYLELPPHIYVCPGYLKALEHGNTGTEFRGQKDFVRPTRQIFPRFLCRIWNVAIYA